MKEVKYFCGMLLGMEREHCEDLGIDDRMEYVIRRVCVLAEHSKDFRHRFNQPHQKNAP
jgi:hypothetical protein